MQHRVVVTSAVDQFHVAPLPGAVDVGVAGLLDAVIIEIFEQPFAITVFIVVWNDFAVDGQQRR